MKLIQKGFGPSRIARDEALFHTANGYLGVRACLEGSVPADILSIRGTYLNGFYDLKPMAYTERLYGFPLEQETMLNVVDAQGITLSTGAGEVSPLVAAPLDYSMELDMEKGLVCRRMRLKTPEGGALDIEICRMASFAAPSLFVISYRVTSVDYAGALTFTSGLEGRVTSYTNPDDPRVAQTAHRHLSVQSIEHDAEGITTMTCGTVQSTLAMGCAVLHKLVPEAARHRHLQDKDSAADCFTLSIAPGETVVLEKWCAYCDSRREPDPGGAAKRLLQTAAPDGLAAWHARQRAFLDAFWASSRVLLEGEESLQTAMDYALYQLLQAAGRDRISGVAAKGLSGEGYEGHSFWDTEIYIFPFFLLAHPEMARNLLQYRYHLLDAARAHARTMGHARGALYPWRTIAGRECSGYFPSGSAQYHINGDIAHAFSQYWLLTRDLDFMTEYGAEVLIETARLWLETGHYHGGAFHIDNVTGPDEYTCIVNNNYYTNISAKNNLQDAADICEVLQKENRWEPLREKLDVTGEELWSFREAAKKMYLPFDNTLGILAQDDSFLSKKQWNLADIPPENFPLLLHYHPLFLYRHQVLKQADAVLALLLYAQDMEEETMRRTYRYYEAITTHDSSLSPCVYGMMASRLGEMSEAEHYFIQTARLDLDDAHGNTSDGLHIANLGGVYLGVVMGFAGLCNTKECVSLNPRLPSFLKSYTFPFRVGDSLLRFSINRNEKRLELLSGPPVQVRVDGKSMVVGGDGTRPIYCVETNCIQ